MCSLFNCNIVSLSFPPNVKENVSANMSHPKLKAIIHASLTFNKGKHLLHEKEPFSFPPACDIAESTADLYGAKN